MFVVVVEFNIKPAHQDDFMQAMVANAQASLQLEDGCHHFDVDVSIDNPNLVFLYEIYDDRAAFDTHLQSEHFISFNSTVTNYVASKQVRFFNRISG
jgi:quinol monooxygenase YgiN